MSCTVNDILTVARGWLGKKESDGSYLEILNLYNNRRPLARGYKIKSTDEWCDCFVSACAIKANAIDIIGTEVGCEKHVSIFKKKHIWIEDGSVKPKPGDIIVYNWNDKTQPNNGFADHIGIVEQQYGNTIVCIEGNKGNAGKVARRTINVGWGYIRGFARPRYDPDTKPITKPHKKSTDTIAREVIRGAWGKGLSRISALKKAGYDPNIIQERVNFILKNPTKKKSVTTIAKEVIRGEWGNGSSRTKALKDAGYNPLEIQNVVNKLV